MELEKTVQDEFSKIVENGTVQKIIAENLEKTIKDVIQNCVRSYSDFGKNLEKVVSEAMQVDMSKLTLLDYNHIVTTIIKEELDKSLFDNVRQPIIDSIKNITGVLDKKDYKLSEVIEIFIESIKDEEYEGEISLHVDESSYGYHHIYFDEDSDKKNHNCSYQLDIDSKGKIYSFKAGKYIPTTNLADFRKTSDYRSGFDAFMFKLWANGCIMEVDEYECQKSWCND